MGENSFYNSFQIEKGLRGLPFDLCVEFKPEFKTCSVTKTETSFAVSLQMQVRACVNVINMQTKFGLKI
jgi:hypothetical protein